MLGALQREAEVSRKQRRDHDPVPGVMRQGITPCRVCGDRLRQVVQRREDPDRPQHKRVQPYRYWRHWRRFMRKEEER